MKLNNVCRGHALRTVVGIIMLTLLLAVGASAIEAPTHSDDPANIDRLNRKVLAFNLVKRLRRVWYENKKLKYGAFMVHIHGPWGSGKTSLLNFMHESFSSESLFNWNEIGESLGEDDYKLKRISINLLLYRFAYKPFIRRDSKTEVFQNSLKEFLIQNFDLTWAENAKIEKIDEGEIIRVSTGENSLQLILSNKNKIKMEIYLFSWDNIPGDDKLLLDFLKKNYNIDWLKEAKLDEITIEKINDGRTIKISVGKNSILLVLKNKRTKATKVSITINDDIKNDDIKDELIAKTENKKLNIYHEDWLDVRDTQWVVVDFNAWQNQSLGPPWWSLMDTVYRKASQQLKKYNRLSAYKFIFKELKWRFSTGRLIYFVALPLLFWILAVITWIIPPPATNASVINDTMSLYKIYAGYTDAGYTESLSTIIALLTTVGSIALALSRSLIFGSSRAARNYMEASQNPLQQLTEHFIDMVKWISRPIVIFIDDLDRCQDKYVVELLEGIQTLFKKAPVIYVIAADHNWLCTSYERNYDTFKNTVKEPGRSLGYLFLEKTFQFSVPLPRLSSESQEKYWGHLIGTDESKNQDQIRQIRKEVSQEFQKLNNQEQIMAKIPTQEFLFSWDEIPGNDNIKLIDSLKNYVKLIYYLKKFNVDWVRRALIKKIDSNTIFANTAYPKHYIYLRLNDEKTKVNLEIDNDKTGEFIVKTENNKLNIYSIEDYIRKEIVVQEAVKRLATPEVEKHTEHILKNFSPLLEPNPRSMKRFVNAYNIQRDIALLSNIRIVETEDWKKLALWTIILLRWPLLAEYLQDNPEIVKDIIKKSIAITQDKISEDLWKLFQNKKEMEKVFEVIEGKKVGISLDENTICNFAHLRTTDSKIRTVAWPDTGYF